MRYSIDKKTSVKTAEGSGICAWCKKPILEGAVIETVLAGGVEWNYHKECFDEVRSSQVKCNNDVCPGLDTKEIGHCNSGAPVDRCGMFTVR